ncbi:MAG: hypothetical protein QM538_02430 [Methylacidiphilales bacterium]|nr:hypothetical protein [Candidatus Methylacidiphilales bacterium]
MGNYVKLVVFVPCNHSDKVREAIALAGAGKLGNYDFCSFSTKGIGRFRPLPGATPSIGTTNTISSVEEEKIEVLVKRTDLPQVLNAMKLAHPYEEVAYEVYPLEHP